MNKNNQDKGFTLVELLIVIVILALLMWFVVARLIRNLRRKRQAAEAS